MAWNQGAGVAADYANHHHLASKIVDDVSTYKTAVDDTWAKADQVICDSEAFTCEG